MPCVAKTESYFTYWGDGIQLVFLITDEPNTRVYYPNNPNDSAHSGKVTFDISRCSPEAKEDVIEDLEGLTIELGIQSDGSPHFAKTNQHLWLSTKPKRDTYILNEQSETMDDLFPKALSQIEQTRKLEPGHFVLMHITTRSRGSDFPREIRDTLSSDGRLCAIGEDVKFIFEYMPDRCGSMRQLRNEALQRKQHEEDHHSPHQVTSGQIDERFKLDFDCEIWPK